MIAPPRPPHYDPELLIKEARERRLRRRLLATVGVAVAAGIALGVYSISGGFGQSRTARTPLNSGGAPLCRTSQISVSVPGLTGLLEEGRTGLFVVTNKSGSPCSLPLRAPSAGITLNGSKLPVHQVKGRGIVLASWDPLRVTHLLKPGGKAAISSYWQNWCGSHSYRQMFTEHYRFDSQLVVSLPIGPHPFCADRRRPSTIRVSRPLLVRS